MTRSESLQRAIDYLRAVEVEPERYAFQARGYPQWLHTNAATVIQLREYQAAQLDAMRKLCDEPEATDNYVHGSPTFHTHRRHRRVLRRGYVHHRSLVRRQDLGRRRERHGTAWLNLFSTRTNCATKDALAQERFIKKAVTEIYDPTAKATAKRNYAKGAGGSRSRTHNQNAYYS